MGLVPGDAHKTAYPIGTDILGKINVFDATNDIGICFHKNTLSFSREAIIAQPIFRHESGGFWQRLLDAWQCQ